MSDYPHNSDSFRSNHITRNEPAPIEEPAPAPIEEPAAPAPAAPARRKTTAPASTREDFTAPTVPLQVKLPQDLIQSLKLHSISTGKTMSELVLDCMTSGEFIGKAWVSTRRAA